MTPKWVEGRNFRFAQGGRERLFYGTRGKTAAICKGRKELKKKKKNWV